MIDVHCHLEQRDYDNDREAVIGRAREKLDAVITCCAHPRDFDATMRMVEAHRGFVFACASIHPEYVKEVGQVEKASFLETLRDSRDRIVAIGETGLDYYWTKEPEWRENQRRLFVQLIELSEELKKPLVIHSRDAHLECVETLEESGAKNVVLHMFGANELAKRVVDNGWFVSLNTILLRSKKHKKVARDVPLDRLMLETDAPWLGFGARNEPTSVASVAEKMAEIKGVDVSEVAKTTTENAIKFFSLPL